MRVLFLGSVLVLLSACIGAGSISDVRFSGGDVFPILVGIDLLGEDRQLPETFAGDLNLVVVAFKREQQEDVNTWISVADDLMAMRDDFRFYEIPFIYEVSAPYRFWINNGMRSGIPDVVARERTITVYTDRAPFFDAMQMQEDIITVLLLDSDGRIVWRTDGPAVETSIELLKAAIAGYDSL